VLGFAISAIVQAWVPRGARRARAIRFRGATGRPRDHPRRRVLVALVCRGRGRQVAVREGGVSRRCARVRGWDRDDRPDGGAVAAVRQPSARVARAREQSRGADPGHMHVASSTTLPGRRRLVSRDAWSDVAHNFTRFGQAQPLLPLLPFDLVVLRRFVDHRLPLPSFRDVDRPSRPGRNVAGIGGRRQDPPLGHERVSAVLGVEVEPLPAELLDTRPRPVDPHPAARVGHPALGSGERLFGETSDTKAMRLVEARTIGDGLVYLTYELVRNASHPLCEVGWRRGEEARVDPRRRLRRP
jgi:hypothetical protein